MATADWPNSPSVGQIYILGDRVWLWNGEGWSRILNSGQVVSLLALLEGPFILLNNPEPLPIPIGWGSMVLLTHI